jgi:putative membrane protein
MNTKSKTFISVGVSALIIAFGIWFLWGHSTSWYMPAHGGWMMGYNGMMGGGGSIIMIILWVLIIVGVVLFISAAVNKTENTGEIKSKTESPIDILKHRYARGEIDKAEYEQKLNDLSISG